VPQSRRHQADGVSVVMSTLRIGDWEALERRRAVRARLLRSAVVLVLACTAFACSLLLGRLTMRTGGGSRAGHSQNVAVLAVPATAEGVPSALSAGPAIPAQLSVPAKPSASASSSAAASGAPSPAAAVEPSPVPVSQLSSPRSESSAPQRTSTPAPEVSSAPAPQASPAPAPAAPSAPASSPAPAPRQSGGEGTFDSSG
jgi:hypothetical protein